MARDAWMGAACTLPADALAVEAGTIHLRIGKGGYVGLVRQADGQIHVGAALDPRRSKALGGPANHIKDILGDKLSSLIGAVRGTGLLTRRRSTIGGQRVLCVGDACGYVEPFTGEGIAWALASAEAAVPLLPMDLTHWPSNLPRQWKMLHARTVGRRQRICRVVRFTVRRLWLWRIVSAIANRAPSVMAWLAPTPGVALAGDGRD